MNRSFFAFPDKPAVREVIDRAVDRFSKHSPAQQLKAWPAMDIAGSFIASEVTSELENADTVFADITFLNFNVFYEIAFALAKHKRVVPTANKSLEGDVSNLSRLGLLDTVGRTEYSNSDELVEVLQNAAEGGPINFPPQEINTAKPIYVLQPRIKGEGITQVLKMLTKSGLNYRSYDPEEEPRLALTTAFEGIQKSLAFVVHLLSPEERHHQEHNLRAAFLVGLAHGMGIDTLILQKPNAVVPADYRDFVSTYNSEDQLSELVSSLAPSVLKILQSGDRVRATGQRTLLEQLDIGSPAAENETEKLRAYYLETDESRRVISGGARLVVGRKGTGKTALYFYARDRLSNDARNLVLPILPDGSQLSRFKETIFRTVDEPAKEHISTALWEYVLLLEVLRTYLKVDKQKHVRNHNLYEPYIELEKISDRHGVDEAEDFTDLISMLVDRLVRNLPSDREDRLLSASKVTEALYADDLLRLSEEIRGYANTSGLRVWILIDNLDKGWPTHGVGLNDIMLLRGLIEGLRKIERFFEKDGVYFSASVFLRNDVYDFLIDNTPDRGKESKITLDWTDPDLLKKMLKERLCYAGKLDAEEPFDTIWRQISTSIIQGKNSIDYLIERSMMRPRNLIRLISYARSNSVNLEHGKITESDIYKAVSSFSADITKEIGFEIRDIFPVEEDILYVFLDCPRIISVLGAMGRLSEELEHGQAHELVELLLWFGFFGVYREVPRSTDAARDLFIHDVDYDFKKLLRRGGGLENPDTKLCVHPAFHAFLEVTG